MNVVESLVDKFFVTGTRGSSSFSLLFYYILFLSIKILAYHLTIFFSCSSKDH